MKNRKKNTNFIIILLFILLGLLILLINTNGLNIISTLDSKLYISEIMAINKNTIKDSDDDYSDYIEIYNGYDYEINLKGYFLSDEVTSNKKWEFPNLIIKPKEHLLIYASEKNKCDLTIKECHTNFKLSSSGETVSLLDNSGKVISKVKYKELSEDTSYSLIDNNYKITIGSPYKENKDIKVNLDDTKDIIINEVTIKSPEAIELKNLTDKDIDLSNYYIEDKSNTKYQFKDIKIKANSYLVLYGSDKPSINNNKIYLGFKINNSNEVLSLYKKQQINRHI